MATLLVIDAYDAFREAMEYCLPKFGHEAITARGLEAARLLPMHRPVDLILLDAGYPAASGIATCRIMKLDPRWQRVPLVLMTGPVTTEFMMIARASGADAVLAKPFEWEQLLGLVARLLRSRVQPLANC